MFKFSHAVCVVYFAGVMDLYLTPLLSRAESLVSSLSPHETPSDGAQMAVVAKLSPIHPPLHHVRSSQAGFMWFQHNRGEPICFDSANGKCLLLWAMRMRIWCTVSSSFSIMYFSKANSVKLARSHMNALFHKELNLNNYTLSEQYNSNITIAIFKTTVPER